MVGFGNIPKGLDPFGKSRRDMAILFCNDMAQLGKLFEKMRQDLHRTWGIFYVSVTDVCGIPNFGISEFLTDRAKTGENRTTVGKFGGTRRYLSGAALPVGSGIPNFGIQFGETCQNWPRLSRSWSRWKYTTRCVKIRTSGEFRNSERFGMDG